MSPLGLIVLGDNHFLIRGPMPDSGTARLLARRWTFPSTEDLLGLSPPLPSEYQITAKAFREDIEWAIVLSSSIAHTPAITLLLEELAARNLDIHFAPGPNLP